MRQCIYIYLFCLLIGSAAKAELTRFPCEAQDLDQLNSIFFLKQGTAIETSPNTIKKKIKIRVRAWFADSMANDETIKSQAKFYDSLGNEIGKTLQIISPERFTRSDNNGRIMIELFGFINDFVVLTESNIEFKLNTFLNKQKKEYIYNDLKKHIIENNYYRWNVDSNFASYAIDEYPVDIIHPGKRIVLIFAKDELVAIIYSRNLKIKYYESQAESKPYKIYYLKKMRDDDKRKIAGVFFKQVRSK
ncbi:MAG: hypothetical protein SGJ10_06070 [Bacteroidota bacterium]|nr:hypothetical protein [Bacteroidota bacterium]